MPRSLCFRPGVILILCLFLGVFSPTFVEVVQLPYDLSEDLRATQNIHDHESEIGSISKSKSLENTGNELKRLMTADQIKKKDDSTIKSKESDVVELTDDIDVKKNKEDKNESLSTLSKILFIGVAILFTIFLFIVARHFCCAKKSENTTGIPRATVSLFADNKAPS